MNLHIRRLAPDDTAAALQVINAAAAWYREFLPPDELHEPEMTAEQFGAEARRMTWFGAFEGETLRAVMGLEPLGDVALVRHGYVVPTHQRSGVGSALLDHLEREAGDATRIVIGTYAANYKAQASLEKAGYTLSSDSQEVLRRYFSIPHDRARRSVTYEKPLPRRA